MEKLLKNKALPYVFLGLIGLFEFISSVILWANGAFTISGFITLLVELGLLFCLGFSIYKKNNNMVLFSATPLLVVSTLAWFTTSEGPLRGGNDGISVTYGVFLLLAAIGLLGTLVLLYVKSFGCGADLKLVATIIGLSVAFCLLICFIVSLCGGFVDASLVIGGLSKIVFALLVAVMPYNLEVK